VQRTYEDLASHYGTTVLPARPRKPRDKAKVEVGVQVAQRWILAVYLHRLDTLDAVRRLVAQYVGDHNDLIPRVELGGRTPTEAYEGSVCDERPCERVDP
jgi:transposase